MNVIDNSSVLGIDSELWWAMSRFVRHFSLVALFAASLISCPAFAEGKAHDLATFFSGRLTAKGKFKNFHDGSTRGVRVDIRGAPDGNSFKLIQDTTYSDGEKQHKVWRFSKIGKGRYVGRRADLVGPASVVAHGNNIEIAYRARVSTKDGKTHELNFKETYLFTRPGTATYWLRASLLFIPMGEARLTIRKLPR
ncbi:DUF3833 family protein [Methylocystis sp. FS]|uniref:DUF3833 family protein n=1 Tax=Methylocystis silviterrae TaxID=2743612 RepID=UPI0015831971|nr:DUF3833 family protein [Methylocystis silviterrae]NUJ79374.1 DUF3833 family protein [Methylocystis silviterrae]